METLEIKNNTGNPWAKSESRQSPSHFTKVNPKWIVDLIIEY